MCAVVTFGHRSAFPVLFDVESIEKWWKSSLVFKVYCKCPAQKMVSDDVHSYLLLFTLNLFSLLKSAFLIFVEYIIVSVRYIPLYWHELCCCFHYEQYDVLQVLHFWYWHWWRASVHGTMPLPSGVC